MTLRHEQRAQIQSYLDTFKDLQVLKKDEIDLFIEDIRGGNARAKEIFIEHNMRLVISLSFKFVNDVNHISDIIQYGVEGLMKSIVSYDTKKSAFSSWATYYIKTEIKRNLYKDNTEVIEDHHIDVSDQFDVSDLIGSLEEQEQSVISGLFGFDGKAMGLRKLGKKLGLPWRKVQTIERRAMAKLQFAMEAI